MIVLNSAVKQLYCEKCGRILDQARTTKSHYQLERMIDPAVSQKAPKEILTDITINTFIGWDEIQIDPPRSTQFTAQKIKFSLRKKAKALRKKTKTIQPPITMAA